MNDDATTPIIPDFIFELFQNEIKKINMLFLKKICEHYHINFEEAKMYVEKDLKFSLELSNMEQIKIVKKQKLLDPEERCIARVYNNKEMHVYQCTRKKYDCDFCKRHKKMNDKDGLKHGTIKDSLPGELIPKELKKLKKYNIY